MNLQVFITQLQWLINILPIMFYLPTSHVEYFKANPRHQYIPPLNTSLCITKREGLFKKYTTMSLLPLAKLIIPYSNFFNYFKNVILQLAYSYENSNQVHTLHLVTSGTQSKTLPWKSSLSWPFVFKSLICWRKQHLSYRISHTFLCLLMPSLVVIFNFLFYPPDFLYPRL